MKARILIAEDSAPIREGLTLVLAGEGYDYAAAADGDEALAEASTDTFDLLLLDVMMPGKSGYEVCKQLRQAGNTVPVIFLTAKSEEIDKVLGLELGADDYITKPFGVRELVARIAAVLRRTQRSAVPTPATAAHTLGEGEFRFGQDIVDQRRYVLKTKGGEALPLSARETTLLRVFHDKPGVVLSRNELLDACWGVDYLGGTRTLDQHIAQLRKKLTDPTSIETVHGIGYRGRPAKQA